MAEINHRYLKDNDNEIFYPITHIDAVQGIDQESTDNALTDMNDKINQMNTLITEANKTIAEQKNIIDEQQKSIKGNKDNITFLNSVFKDVTGDTGWIKYSTDTKNLGIAITSGYDNTIREIRIGNSEHKTIVRIKSIRINLSGIKDGVQVAQLPEGFMKDNQYFDLVGSAKKPPVSFKVKTDGTVVAYLKDYESAKESWVYGQFTWLE